MRRAADVQHRPKPLLRPNPARRAKRKEQYERNGESTFHDFNKLRISDYQSKAPQGVLIGGLMRFLRILRFLRIPRILRDPPPRFPRFLREPLQKAGHFALLQKKKPLLSSR
jgi:hypothetical protein